jgi:hypothetical protein
LDQLAGYPCLRPHGGWSLLIDTHRMGLTPEEASQRLFTRAQVAATPDGWLGAQRQPVPAPGLRQRGGVNLNWDQTVTATNEPAERLTDLRTASTPR